MLKLRPFRTFPRWEFLDPDTQYYHRAPDRDTLLARVNNYRQQNDLEPIINLNDVVENYMCGKKYNIGLCEPNKTLSRSLLTYIKGGVALLKSIAYNSFVSQEEADRRALICIKCPKNIFPDKKRFVEWADKLAEATVGDRKSAHHDKLGNCEVCSCCMRSKIFYDGKLDFTPKEYKQFPSFCWQKQLYDKQQESKS